METKKREIKYDYLRTFAVLAVIMVHAIPGETANKAQWLFSAALTPVLLAFVGIFFMLSGLFLLQSYEQDIKEFYWRRFCGIFIPFAVYCGIYYWYYNVLLAPESQTWYEHGRTFIFELVTQSIPSAPHLWFMYVMIALYVCTPFLARMFHAMTDRELKLFLIIMLLVQGLSTYLPPLGINIEPAIAYMIFKGWLIYFVLGYIGIRLYRNSSYLPFAILGAAGFFVTLFQKYVTPAYTPGIHDMAYPMIAMAVSIFLLFYHFGDIQIPFLMKGASFVSRYSYSVYLIHYLILGQVVKGLAEKTMLRHYYVTRIFFETAVTFVISLAVAVIVDETVVKLLKMGANALKGKRKLKKEN
jgi:peptidoglycan/LPS O-acetylase OafA/YrhL